MSFRPNSTGPFCPTGVLTGVASGTGIPLSVNWSPDFNPQTKTNPETTNPSSTQVPEYSISFDDIIINSPASNAGGIYLCTYNIQGASGGITDPNTILLYIPKGSGPVSIRHLLGLSRINPNSLCVDFDSNGDTVWCTGVI